MSDAQELGRLIVRLMGDGTDYLHTLEKAQKDTSAFVQDANGRFRDLQGRFVSVNEVMRSQAASTLQKLNALGVGMQDWAARGKVLGQSMRSAGVAMSAGLTVPLLAIGGYATKAAIDFESSFAGVRKTVNATEEEFQMLSRGMRDLSLTTPVDVNELNKIGEAAGQLGIKTGNILKFTETIAALGVSTNLSTDEAATSFARFISITGSGQKTVEKLGSSVVALGNNFATSESEIVAFMMRIAGAGSLVGLTDAQIAGMSAALSQVGLEAEAGGTAVQKMLLGITSEVTTNGEMLSQFAAVAGMNAEQFKQAWATDAAGAFTEFVEGLGSQGQAAIGILQELGVEDERSIRTFLSLAGAGDVLREALDLSTKAYEESKALAEEAGKRYATTASQLQLLWNSVKDVAVELGTEFIPMIRTMVDLFRENFVPIMMSAVQWFNNLSPATQGWALALGTILVVAGPVLIVMGSLISSISSIIGLLGSMIATVKSLAATMVVLNVASGGWLYILEAAAAAVIALATAFGYLASISEDAGTKVSGTMVIDKKMEADQADAAKRQATVQKALAEAGRLQMAKEEAEKAFKSADKSVSDLLGNFEKENALFGLKGPQRDIASLEYDLKKKGMSESLSPEEKSRLESLAKELTMKEKMKKIEEEIAKVREKAAEDHDKQLESMAEQARQYLEDQLKPIEKLKMEFNDIWKLVDVGALTAAQAQSIMQGKVSAMASQITTGETLRSAGAGVYSGSKEALIAQRQGPTTTQKSVEDGIWEQVNRMNVSIETQEEILEAIRAKNPFVDNTGIQTASF